MEKLSVKISFEDDIRRFSVNGIINWDKIESNIKKLFPNIELNNYQMVYQDDEGDWIVINSQEELQEAITQLDKNKPILRISLKQKKQNENGFKSKNGRCGLGWRKNHIRFTKLHHETLSLMKSNKKEDLLAAKSLLNEQLQLRPNHPIPTYNLACTEALLGNSESAIDHLEKSVTLGFRDVSHIENDKDLETLRQDKRFQELVKNLKQDSSLGEQCIQKCLSKFKKTMLHQKIMHLFDVGTKEALESAKKLLLKQASLEKNDSIPPYNLSCVEALLGNTKAALEYLEQAISLGYNSLDHIMRDNDLVSIHQLPEFQKIVSVLQSEKNVEYPINDAKLQPNSLESVQDLQTFIEEKSIKQNSVEEIKQKTIEEKPIQQNSEMPTNKNSDEEKSIKQISEEYKNPEQESSVDDYTENLNILYNMGFYGKEKNLRALTEANGNLEAAVSYLLN